MVGKSRTSTPRSFETQLGQFAADLKGRQIRTLPSHTETPKGTHKEHIKAMTLRSDASMSKPDDGVLIETLVQEKTTHPFDRSNFPALFPLLWQKSAHFLPRMQQAHRILFCQQHSLTTMVRQCPLFDP
ncbi:hypothetical protein L6452_15283 [Arctium lappa]|uniref:Uncharacterized protein n=1 Tax=Arctium lappa TaxID=4217 RepID=A0ACB9CNI8_ARCLA|nr:hypothetical protein L6452_15283 [Arctium lappa]